MNRESSTPEIIVPSILCGRSGMLDTPLPALNDPEGERVPDSLPPIVDAHVHIFPDGIFSSIWKWFEKFGWPIRYQLKTSEVLEFLLCRGIGHIIALQYAHKPGIARYLNAYMAKQCSLCQHITGIATVFPGEEDATGILEDAFQLGLGGVKLHAHVQCFDMNSESMQNIYNVCAVHDKPLIMHVGREPKSPAYDCDPHLLCSAAKLEQVLKDYPQLKICVPHLGADEFVAYQKMIERYDNLWLDTAMIVTDYLPNNEPLPLNEMRIDRIMYGTDFPCLPFAWDRELRQISELGLPKESLELILGQNAIKFFSISTQI